MLNTQRGSLIERVSKEVMASIDLLGKPGGGGSRSNLFGECFAGARPLLQWFESALPCGG